MQGAKAAASSAHSNVAPASLEKAKVALVPGVCAEVIVVSGAVVSTVQLWLAGLVSVLPAASVARTRNWCGPAARLV